MFVITCTQGLEIVLRKQKYSLISTVVQSIFIVISIYVGKLADNVCISIILMVCVYCVIQVVYYETYQCCVIGSDTVWNMFDPTYENIPYFVGKEIGCKNIISYAASVGQSRLSKILILKGYKLLPIRKLSQIAVRDDKTEKVVKILGKKSVRVLDPTFLYDFPIVKPNDLPRKPYMLIYTYGYNNEEVAAIKNMAKKKGLLTIATGSLCPWADINMVVGSFEWLWLVKNADLIVTGTFHGSVFSIKYNKQFAVLTQGSDKVDSLLSEFGLTDRTATVETIENVLSKDIDYTRVNKIIEEKKERSQNYLLSAVED